MCEGVVPPLWVLGVDISRLHLLRGLLSIGLMLVLG